jgi:transcriptional antiterminator NusG
MSDQPLAIRDEPSTMSNQLREAYEPSSFLASQPSSEKKWHVLWTRSHCEQAVFDQLAPKGFHLFLPKIDVWSRRNGVRHRANVPMFPGYLFFHHTTDSKSYIELRKARGLVKILGESWDRLAVVPDNEIDAIQRVHNARLPALPHPYLREGQRVRITDGLLAGAEGILLQTKPNKGLLVLSVNLLQRSVAVEVDCALVAPA